LSTVVSKTANYTTVGADGTVLCDASGGAFTITLVTAVGRSGKIQAVKKTDSTINVVTVAGDGGETIDGAATYALEYEAEVVWVQSDGSNWRVIGD
jgi:hypothetical protein